MSSNVKLFFDPELRARLARRGTAATPATADELRAENQRMREEITRLRAEVVELRARGGAAGSTAAGSAGSAAAGSAPSPPADPPVDDSSLRFMLMEIDD